MAPLIALLIIAIFSPVIQSSPTTSPDALTTVEKEIVLVHQHIIPGLTVAAKHLKDQLPLSSKHSLERLYRMINPLLKMFDFMDTLNETSNTFRIVEAVIEDACKWLGLENCQKEALQQIKQKLELQIAFEIELFNLQNTYLPSLCKQKQSLSEDYCYGYRGTTEWKQENMIL